MGRGELHQHRHRLDADRRRGTSAHAFAERLAKEPIETELWTSISHAIDYAVPLFKDNGYAGIRKVIDISGDGANNQGGLVTIHRDSAVAAGITINGLPIVNHRASPWGWPQLPDLDLYYAACVIGGSGAFYVVANTFADFARAVRQKLLLEVANRVPGDGPERIFKVAASDARSARRRPAMRARTGCNGCSTSDRAAGRAPVRRSNRPPVALRRCLRGAAHGRSCG